MRVVSLWVGLGLLVSGGCFEDSSPVDDEGGEASSSASTSAMPCDQGSAGCACFPNGTCSAGLVCNLGVCEVFDPTTTSTTSGSTPSDETSTTDAPTTTGTDTSTDDAEAESSTGMVETAHILFTTSDIFSGIEIGGLAAADDICGTLGRGVRRGAWVAVLQDSTTSLTDRITIEADVVNMQGEILATDDVDLFSGILLDIPGYDETGDMVSGSALAWTGSMADNCMDWTNDDLRVFGAAGLPTDPELWLDTTVPLPCSTPVRLYCISQ